jgi:hypothetical protein
MPCASDQCSQGRKACPSPLICEPGLHRIDNGWHHHEPIDSDDPLYSPEEATWGTWAILIGLALALIFMTALAIAPHI